MGRIMKTLKDLQTELLKTSLTKDEVYFKNVPDFLGDNTGLIIENLFDNGNIIIDENNDILYKAYKGETTILLRCNNLQLIYDWIIATMKMQEMRINSQTLKEKYGFSCKGYYKEFKDGFVYTLKDKTVLRDLEGNLIKEFDWVGCFVQYKNQSIYELLSTLKRNK
jgi:hypothetical protein